MSIMSDSWIRAQCERPTHIVMKSSGGVEYASFPFTNFQQGLLNLKELYSELNITNVTDPNNKKSLLNFKNDIRPITPEELSRWKPMIYPYFDKNVREVEGQKIVSYGVSSYGYDVRLSDRFKLFTNVNATVIDPLNPPDDCFVDFQGPYCIIPPNSYMLGYTMETFCIPDDVSVVCLGKSTYARLGAIINVTPIEAEFEGNVVIEISNSTPLPLKVYANQGIAQFQFFQGDQRCRTTYRERNGKYQGQTGITTAKL